MFYFRINKLKVYNNCENPAVWDPFNLLGTDVAEVKLYSLVTTGDMMLPDMDKVLLETDDAARRDLVRAAVKQAANSRVLTEIHNIKDRHVMTFGDAGYSLFQTIKIPQDFNWLFLAVESDRDVREFGDHLKEITHRDGFDEFVQRILELAGDASNPAAAAAVYIARFICDAVAEALIRDHDDMMGIIYMSLNRTEHYPHGVRNADDVADLTNNMWVDYSIFGF